MDEAALNRIMRPRKLCVCRSVSREEIVRAVTEEGADTFERVQALTNCSTGCGTCEPRVRDLIRMTLNGRPSPRA